MVRRATVGAASFLVLALSACGGVSSSTSTRPQPFGGEDGCPHWSPDGRWIAFDRTWSGWGTATGGDPALEERDVVLVDRAGRRVSRRTVTAADEHVLGWRRSPLEVVFERVRPGRGALSWGVSDAIPWAHWLFAASPSGTARPHLLARLPDAATLVELSPNGRLVALGFAAKSRFFQEWRVGRVGRPAAPIRPRAEFAVSASWSQDSRRLDFRRPRGGPAVSILLDREGRVVGRTRGIDGAYRTVGKRSPDGALVAFLAYAPVGADRVAVARADGSGRRLVARTDGSTPTWSSDSALVVYGLRGDIRVVEATGANDRRITRIGGAGFECLAVSPDGGRIAFLGLTKTSPGFLATYDRELFVMNADGSGKRKVPLA